MPYPSKTNQEEILATAVEIVEREGIESLSMREIAKRLELFPNALYHHFKDREELEAEIAAEGYRQLLADTRKAVVQEVKRINKGEDLDREGGVWIIIKLSKAYLQFARRRPQLYKVMIRRHPPTPGLVAATRELQEFSQGFYSWMKSPEVIAEARFALFALMHGIATLEREGILEEGHKRDPTRAITAVLAGLTQLNSQKTTGD